MIRFQTPIVSDTGHGRGSATECSAFFKQRRKRRACEAESRPNIDSKFHTAPRLTVGYTCDERFPLARINKFPIESWRMHVC